MRKFFGRAAVVVCVGLGAVGVGGGAGGGGDENCAIEGLKATFGDHVTLPAYPAPAAQSSSR